MGESTSDVDRIKRHIREHATALSKDDYTLGDEAVADDCVGHDIGTVEEMCSPDEDREFVVHQSWRNHD